MKKQQFNELEQLKIRYKPVEIHKPFCGLNVVYFKFIPKPRFIFLLINFMAFNFKIMSDILNFQNFLISTKSQFKNGKYKK